MSSTRSLQWKSMMRSKASSVRVRARLTCSIPLTLAPGLLKVLSKLLLLAKRLPILRLPLNLREEHLSLLPLHRDDLLDLLRFRTPLRTLTLPPRLLRLRPTIPTRPRTIDTLPLRNKQSRSSLHHRKSSLLILQSSLLLLLSHLAVADVVLLSTLLLDLTVASLLPILPLPHPETRLRNLPRRLETSRSLKLKLLDSWSTLLPLLPSASASATLYESLEPTSTNS